VRTILSAPRAADHPEVSGHTLHAARVAPDRGPGADGARLDTAQLLGDPVPFFQPIIDLATGAVTGYEALSRFPHLPGEPVDEVFALAHRNDRGFELEVLAASRALALAHLRPAGTTLSFNLSPSTLCHPGALGLLPDDLSGLQVEVTENELVADATRFRAALEELRERGAQIAVDDVGEGYAGLQRVMAIRPDVLKLDRSLVSGVDSRPDLAALLEAVVRFAARVGAQVCAEGIETEDELALLADLDVAYGQGWFIGRPAPGFEPASPRAASRCTAALSEAVTLGDQRRTGDLVAALLAVAAADDLPALARVLTRIAPAIGADAVELSYLDPAGRYVEAVLDTEARFKGVKFYLADLPLTRRVLDDDVAAQVVIDAPGADPHESAWMREDGVGSLLMVPVRSRSRVVGLFECHQWSHAPWRRSQIRAARHVAAVAGPVLENLLRADPPA
jgi:EAL domain-containing protein (putative c-di-GMP-specific phosphodiesterase class I)